MKEVVKLCRKGLESRSRFLDYKLCTVDEDTGMLCVLMEPALGWTLSEYIHTHGVIDEAKTQKIVRQVFEGLMALKKLNLFHG